MVVIIGCGFLGSSLLQTISAHTDEVVVATVRDKARTLPVKNAAWMQCDVTEHGDLLSLAERCGKEPKTVFYFAASHNIDKVCQDPEAARRVNVDALRDFLQTMPGIERLFFSSTDCVYGENSEDLPAFSETSLTNPLNEYGRQKLEAEAIVRANAFTVCRLPLMMGPSPFPKKPHFYDVLCEKLALRQKIEMIDGLKRSVISYRNAAELLFRLSRLPKEQLPPVVNVCSDESFTKYEFGCAIAEQLGVPRDLVCPISEAEGRKFFRDARASCTVMDNSLLKKTLGISSISWEKTL